MNYPYKSHIYLAEVVLNVQNLERQTTFYHQILGLEILLQTEHSWSWRKSFSTFEESSR